jgi:uncharacterized delta-60 repeat protein
LETSEDIAYGIAIDSKGRIIAAGHSDLDFGVTRVLENGTLDPTFGNSGKITTDLGKADNAYDVVVDSNDRIIAVGSSTEGRGEKLKTNDSALVRYAPQ